MAVRYVITVTRLRWSPPSGRLLTMHELIFCCLDGGRLAATWALVDVAGAPTQLRPTQGSAGRTT